MVIEAVKPVNVPSAQFVKGSSRRFKLVRLVGDLVETTDYVGTFDGIPAGWSMQMRIAPVRKREVAPRSESNASAMVPLTQEELEKQAVPSLALDVAIGACIVGLLYVLYPLLSTMHLWGKK